MAKPTVKTLQGDLQAVKYALLTTQEESALMLTELTALRESASRHTAELQALQEKLGLARTALRPFAEKTKDWTDQWPPPEVSVAQKLNWGDIKAAADAGFALQ